MQSGLAGIKFAATTALLSGLLVSLNPAKAVELSLPVTGNLIGSVMDGLGTPQMGATVQLLNRYERVIAKVITTADGRFVFASLPQDSYAVRVSQPSFLPAFRSSINVKPGSDSFLQIHLATLFSNIQVSYKLPSGAMTNDWKWVLRTSAATRPVTRYMPVEIKRQRVEVMRPQVFSDTHAQLRLNGGDSSVIGGDAASDLGSVFALSTNLFGKNQVQIAGSLGQGFDLSASMRSVAAVYRRDSDNPFAPSPEVTLAVSQLNRFGSLFSGSGQIPGLRIMSLTLYQVADPLDNVHLEYGVAGESVDYVQHSARVSPFGRATVSLDPNSEIVASFSDGGRPDALISHPVHPTDAAASPAADMLDAVNALGRIPQMSSREGRLVLQRTQGYELGYTRRAGSRTFAFSGFYEHVWNGQVNLSGNTSFIDHSNLLFDGLSNMSTYNVGSYTRTGYTGSVTQNITQNVDFGLAYGRLGGFLTDHGHLAANDISANQSLLKVGLHDVAGANLRASIPSSGTRLTAGYGWMETGAVVPLHVFTTQSNVLSPGLNFAIQQPLPSLFGLPGHLELTADLRNLLAQGYIPVGAAGAGQLLVVQSPRAIRGGLNLTF